ncbi:cupin domain-containing protein [Actinoplanes sp. NBRC 103695]|uniref:cupin domain-containing protein n=1 Tax=Actinoplanes sp. NBRC 103695 TaxID=3032202 RepID=UPI0024A3682F|nr:cupin domain-containing protein [Actinoplanes sp. NBRC 103695]GLY94142.1 hypothetical protein Acsp02_13980 [Actinoplanes sp. NBRC 103695]
MDGRTTPTGLPRIVSNPVMGVTVEFVTAGDESDGEHVEARVSIPAGDKGPPPHFHTDFEETFTALEGTLFVDLGDRRGISLQPGEPVHVARNVRHRYYNDRAHLSDRPRPRRLRRTQQPAHPRKDTRWRQIIRSGSRGSPSEKPAGASRRHHR